MEADQLLKLADLCQAVTMPICILAYLPQWLTMIKKRTSENISLNTYIIWTGASVLGLIYAVVQHEIHGTGSMLLLSAIVSFLSLVFTVFLISYFKNNKTAVIQHLTSSVAREIEGTQEMLNAIVELSNCPTMNKDIGSEAHL